MLWRTQPWLLWINLWKTCLVKFIPWIRQPSFGYSISPSHWFEISSSRSEQVTGPCIWTPLEGCCHSSMHRATFIMQNQHICTTRRCAACMMSWTWMNSRLIQRKASSPSGTATGSGAVSGLIWPGVDARNEGFWRAHTRARNNREHWLSGYVLCHCVYHCALQVKSSLAAILSPLSSILRHLITKTWDQHNRLVTRQIWSSSSSGLKRIHHFPGIMVAS